MKNFQEILNTKELLWFVGTWLLTLLSCVLIFGLEGLRPDSTLDINVHDTYFVIANYHFILLIGVLLFFGVYFIRAFQANFENVIATLVLLFTTICFILILNGIDTALEIFTGHNSGVTSDSALISGRIDPEINPFHGLLNFLSILVFLPKISLLIFLAYCGFRLGQNWQLKTHKS